MLSVPEGIALAKQTRRILEIEDLCKYFPVTRGFLGRNRGTVKAVDGVSFFINEGETLALVGESGCGKTTTAHCVVRGIEPTSGEIRYYENDALPEDIAKAKKAELKRIRRNIRMVFQDPYSSLNARMTIMEIIGEPLLINQSVKSRKELEEKVVEIIRMVGIDPAYLNRYPHAFSGGQRQRIAVARALVLKPKIVIADEPVSALDVSVQAQILNLLKELQAEFALTYLFIAHNLAVVKHQSDRVAIMYLGKIVELADSEKLFSKPKHPYTEALLSSAPNPDPRMRNRNQIALKGDIANPLSPPNGCSFHPRCLYSKDICRTSEPTLTKLASNDTHRVACHFAEELSLRGIDG